MGRRGPLPKSESERQGHRKTTTALKVVEKKKDEIAAIIPEPAKHWKAVTKKSWNDYWTSDVAAAATEVDLPAITRLHELYDEWHCATTVGRKQMAVTGSMGQIAVNPLLEYANKISAQILKLETEIGKTPLARQRLGLTAAKANLTAAELNKMVAKDSNDDDSRTKKEEIVEAEILEDFETG